MLEHTHTGIELTCVLRGSFSHEGGRFGPGDFDFGDETLDHQPIVGSGEPCLCLVAMTGDLRMNGFFGRLIGPFVRSLIPHRCGKTVRPSLAVIHPRGAVVPTREQRPNRVQPMKTATASTAECQGPSFAC